MSFNLYDELSLPIFSLWAWVAYYELLTAGSEDTIQKENDMDMNADDVVTRFADGKGTTLMICDACLQQFLIPL